MGEGRENKSLIEKGGREKMEKEGELNKKSVILEREVSS